MTADIWTGIKKPFLFKKPFLVFIFTAASVIILWKCFIYIDYVSIVDVEEGGNAAHS